jgi:2-C-methyl-D-erythritol 4-phosphate cytidylyltransferase/2-C-methyl-D-erythritol 4-phosphate cytidylyltransferase/2-C-methyl-D-erythritol 2,4-cyclodiphosphate synthase
MTEPYAAQCHALVPCAGVGERAGFGGPKQYAALAGRSVVAHSLAALAQVPSIVQTVVVVAPSDTQFESAAPEFRGRVVRKGGATRAASVRAGLAALAESGASSADWVLVHDAARCLVRPAAIMRLIEACRDDDVGGLLAIPVADTLKQADDSGRVRTTVDRQGKWAAQTPQMFRLAMLTQALASAGDAVSDEAGAIEALGLAPKLVPGDPDNFKLTWPEDFARAQRLLERQGEQIKAFVPARDFLRSRSFYEALGFVMNADYGNVVHLQSNGMAFLLQDFYEPAHADNFMMSLVTPDLDAWYARAQPVAERFGTRIDPPELRPWGLRDFVLFDPSGVLWRVVDSATDAT